MQGKTRSQKPKLELGLEGGVTKRRLSRVSKIVEVVDVIIESCLNIEPVINSLLKELEMHNQIEEEDIPSNLIGKIFEETNIVREKVLVRTIEVRRKRSPATM